MDSCAWYTFNSLITSSDVCYMLITYASSLDLDQDRPKKSILKKASRCQEKHEQLPSMQRDKEGVDACALRAIRRRAVKCSNETAQLVRITCAFFGHSCNKYLILMGRFVTGV